MVISMKKLIYSITVLSLIGLLSACGKTQTKSDTEDSYLQTEENISSEYITDNDSEKTDIESDDMEDTIDYENSEENYIEQNSTEEYTISENEEEAGIEIEIEELYNIDFTYDYTEDIRADVNYVVSNSTSLQEELNNIDLITQKYTALSQEAMTQMEINLSSKWFYMIWDIELNNLWSRFIDLADSDTKEELLEKQRNWIAMKEEVTLLSLGTRDENGSMYPSLVNDLWEGYTKNRAYYIASELAKINGEAFTMPEVSSKYGLYVDNQGTGSVYSSLNTQQNWEGDDEAIISLYRITQLEGSFVDNGNGELLFTSDYADIKGIIKINGWDGASFEVTEAAGGVLSVGEIFYFPVLF